MGKKVTVTLWEDNWEAVQAVQKAHDEWLELAVQDDPALNSLDVWTVADVINSVLRDQCPDFERTFRYLAEILKRERAEGVPPRGRSTP